MNHVRLSVFLSVRLSVDTWVHYFVRTSARLSFDEFFFLWHIKKRTLELCLGVLFLKNLKIWSFGELFVIIDGSFYGRGFGYPSMVLFLWHIN